MDRTIFESKNKNTRRRTEIREGNQATYHEPAWLTSNANGAHYQRREEEEEDGGRSDSERVRGASERLSGGAGRGE
jgi:hypothetical protein